MTNKNDKYFTAKADKGKIKAGLILQDFPNALKAVAEVATFGANKYSAHSWLNVPDAKQRYTDAMIRHQLEVMAGNKVDSESGLPHLAHFVWGALAILELEQREEITQRLALLSKKLGEYKEPSIVDLTH